MSERNYIDKNSNYHRCDACSRGKCYNHDPCVYMHIYETPEIWLILTIAVLVIVVNHVNFGL